MASSKQQVLLYFENTKSAYERFMNKLWVERKNIFEEKEHVIRASSRWKNLKKIKQNLRLGWHLLPPQKTE